MVYGFPPILSYSMKDNIEPKLAFYANALGGENEAIYAVVNDPRLFSYSLEGRLKPRLKEASELGMVVDILLLSHLAKYTDVKWGNKIENHRRKQLEESMFKE